MKIVIAPDSYKGCLTAEEVAEYMERGVLQVLPEAETLKIPIADGGEGTMDSIVKATNGKKHQLEVIGPIGEPVMASYGVKGNGKTAIIEMCEASGIHRISKDRLNPLVTTTYGTGQLIRAALHAGHREIMIGIGGSATNDGGIGMAQALGIRFLDSNGEEVSYGGGELRKIQRIDLSGLDPLVAESELIIVSDVNNPLCGPNGASNIFGPQKGATPQMIQMLDQGLSHLSEVVQNQLGLDLSNVKGAGAAGGLGFGLMAFLRAKMASGIDTVLNVIEFEQKIKGANLILTGEGKTDQQTAFGKAPIGVGKVAKKLNIPVVCISGGLTDVQSLYHLGIDVIMGITQRPMTLHEAMEYAPELISQAVSTIIRTITIPSKYWKH